LCAAGQPLSFLCLRGYSNNLTIRRRVRSLAPFDLIHIDGDHTLRGKLIDLDFARTVLREDGLVLVDDFDHLPDVVQTAVTRCLRLGWYLQFARLPTTRGLALLGL
jgi:predicted O-methyltransferase YrrM